ncbi:MAG TPA: MaoC family dehydratase [Candidatus Acidoferrum sp.]|nr:MaoC family dehydratase [Candidatus Acidoferrum sp.]
MSIPVVVPTPRSLAQLVGRELAVTDWFAVSQERIQRFAETTEDHQWIHTDRERAQRESPYGTTVAHGFLTLSLLSHLIRQAVHIEGGVRLTINYGLNHVRFPSPVRVGSKVRARFTLHSLREVGGALEAVYGVTVEAQDAEKPCCVAEWIVRYYL